MIAATCERAPTLVMAVGNLLRQDDGVAETVLRALEQAGVPDGVELLDAGTITRWIVSQCVAPRASEASFNSRGTL